MLFGGIEHGLLVREQDKGSMGRKVTLAWENAPSREYM